MNATSVDEGAPGKRAWLSVAEAATYLDVSQPTIFRWMKEGLLSFYKVGGSTRFSMESLDAVVEKTTGRIEAEAAAGKCAACGNSTLVEGSLQGTGRIFFKPLRTRFWTFSESLVPTVARTCTACGHVQIHADTSRLNRIRKKEVEESATD
jgi:excisionase family DNA binding protein